METLESLQTQLVELTRTNETLKQENENLRRSLVDKDKELSRLKDDNYRLFRTATFKPNDQPQAESKISVDDAIKLVKGNKKGK